MSREISAGEDPGDDDEHVSPSREPFPTPWISAADIPLSACPTQRLSDERRVVVEEWARKIANTWTGSDRNHIVGKLGEDALAHSFGLPDRLDVEVYTDGGDGGTDLWIAGACVDVKTVGEQYAHSPELWVAVRESLDADYYALVSRIGTSDFRLIGYAPRCFVANAPVRSHRGERYHVVPRDYLFPFAGVFDMR